MQKPPVFLGTFFDLDQALKIERWLRIVSWIALFANIFENGLYTFQMVYNAIISGFSVDYSMVMLNAAHISVGLIYFVVLQALAKILLILLDIEGHSRLSNRAGNKKYSQD